METFFGIVSTAILHHLAKNIGYYGSAFALFFYVAAGNMPKPGVVWTKLVLYTWFYDTVQTVLPINRGIHHQLQAAPEVSQVDAPKQAIFSPPTSRYGEK